MLFWQGQASYLSGDNLFWQDQAIWQETGYFEQRRDIPAILTGYSGRQRSGYLAENKLLCLRCDWGLAILKDHRVFSVRKLATLTETGCSCLVWDRLLFNGQRTHWPQPAEEILFANGQTIADQGWQAKLFPDQEAEDWLFSKAKRSCFSPCSRVRE